MSDDFYTTYHRWTHAPRSMDEAYRTPEYCNAVTIYPKTMSKGARESIDLVAWFLLTGMFVAFWMGLLTWLIGI